MVNVLVLVPAACTVPVTLSRYNENDGCWRTVTRQLDAAYWSPYAGNALNGCNDMGFTFADVDGHCWGIGRFCTDQVPDDPWISDDPAEWQRCVDLEQADVCD